MAWKAATIEGGYFTVDQWADELTGVRDPNRVKTAEEEYKLLGKYIFHILGRCQRGNESAGLFRARGRRFPRLVNAPTRARISPVA
jgi:hypothetical protein